ncbi:hypothetical protein A6F49_15345 [Enteractinococcus helveticum]|uniref:Uncharacterized protein n=1 Tax=Enteractinococcus helveticum TaxID=1837282 RepID=A0A1B7LW67_9MICC|nr:hypothetical protein A6F49_15345 [Enteractinococcus helveticum]
MLNPRTDARSIENPASASNIAEHLLAAPRTVIAAEFTLALSLKPRFYQRNLQPCNGPHRVKLLAETRTGIWNMTGAGFSLNESRLRGHWYAQRPYFLTELRCQMTRDRVGADIGALELEGLVTNPHKLAQVTSQ